MAYQYTDYSGYGNETDEETRRRRAALLSGIPEGGTFGDMAGHMVNNRIGQAQDTMNQAGSLFSNPEEAFKQRLLGQAPSTAAPAPAPVAGPAMPMPDETQAETQRLLAQNNQPPVAQQQQIAQPPVAPVAPAQPAQPAEQMPQQMAQPPAAPISPEQAQATVQMPELPQPGPAVQVAGPMTTPPAAYTGGGLTPPAGYAPLPSPNQPYIDQYNKGDIYSLANPNSQVPDYIRSAAQDDIIQNYRQQAIKAGVEEKVNNAATNPQEMLKVFDEFKRSKSEDGSYLRAYLLNRLGFSEAANDEMSKLGWGSKYEHTTLGNGEEAMVKYSTKGEPIAGISANGKKLTPKELIEVGTMKGAVTGQTMGYDQNGHVISHTTVPGGKAVVWKDETTGEKLSSAPAGYHTGKNQQEAAALQSYQRSLQNDEAKNRANIAKGLAPIYTKDQMEERAQGIRNQVMGIPSTTYGGGGEGAITPTVPTIEKKVEAIGFTDPSIKVLSAQRTTPEQKKLWDQSVTNGTPGKLPNGNPVAQPGTSLHETNQAIDVDNKSLTKQGRLELAQKGYYQPLPNDPNHWELMPGREASVAARPAVGAGAPSIQDIQKSNAARIANYEAPPLTGSGMGGQNAITMAEVYKLNPNYDGAKYKVMAKTRQDFITGKQGQAVQSMNVAVDHLDSLSEAAQALKNGNMPLFNSIGNMYSKNTGSPAVTDFNALKSIVGSEVAKAVAGGATALGDREEIRAEINAAASEQQLLSAINKYQKLMAGQVKGLRQTYTSAGLPESSFNDKLLPRTKKVLNSVEEPTRSKW